MNKHIREMLSDIVKINEQFANPRTMYILNFAHRHANWHPTCEYYKDMMMIRQKGKIRSLVRIVSFNKEIHTNLEKLFDHGSQS